MSKPTKSQILADIASASVGKSGIWPDNSVVFETIQLDDNAEGSGGLTLAWNSNEFHVIPAGATVGDYVLMEPYFPQDNGGGKYRYEPKFSDPVALLEKTPFILDTLDTEGHPITLFTFPFTGLPGTIIGYLEDSIKAAFGNEWVCHCGIASTASITVDFDGDTLKSAAQKIAQACGCTLHYTWKQLNFGTRAVYGGNEFYNRFIVFGGTTNMSRKTVQGQYTSVVKRLTLDETDYPDSIIDKSSGGTPMTKILVFDEIFPKMELFIDDVHERTCFMLDENGNRIETTSDDNTAETVIVDGVTKYYKTYSKWYVHLIDANGDDFELDKTKIFEGQTLKMLFQPNYDSQYSTPLIGREFEVVYFDTETHEYEADDTDINGYTAEEGWFRICFEAQGETVIPTVSSIGLIPHVENKVTLVNYGIDEAYITAAQSELETAALNAIGDYEKVGLGGKEVAYGGLSNVNVGDLYGEHELFVNTKSMDLITGREEISYGTFGERSLISSMIDKIDNAQTSGGGGTTKSSASSVTNVSGQDSLSWRTLQQAGGNLGVKNVNQTIGGQITDLVEDMEAVQEQVDQKIDMWFRTGVPYPNEYSPSHAANAPASEWSAEDYESHSQDLYYDKSKIPNSYESSLVWRWEYDETLGKWLWKNVTDAHTIDALEKIVDVASDGVISTGTEKSRLLIEWNEAVAKYSELSSSASNLGTKYTAYVTAFQAVGTMLNGGSTLSDVSVIPLWLNASNFDTNTKLSDYNVSPSTYRTTWNAYYAALEDLTGEIKAKKCSIFVSNSVPTPPYNVGDMWIIPNEDNKVKVCINGRSSGSGTAADWQDLSASEDVRAMLALMVEQSYSVIKEILANVSGGWNHFMIFMSPTTSSGTPSTESPAQGSILFMPKSSSHSIYYYDSGWVNFEGNEDFYASLYAALEKVYNSYVSDTLVTFYVYSSFAATPQNLLDNSLIAHELSYTDPVTNTPLKGGIDIFWYSGNEWELISKATSAAIENLGNAVRMVVFGNEKYGKQGESVTIASGSAFGKALGMLFSEALDESGNLITGARIATYIKQGSGSNEKHILSGVEISADKVTFVTDGTIFNMLDGIVTLLTSKSPNLEKALGMVIRQDGSNGEFSFGSYVNNVFKAGLQFKDVTENGVKKTKLLLTADNVDIAAALFTLIAQNITLAAERINFKTGNFSITDGNNNVTFAVDANGNVSLAGTITAKAGYIGGAGGWAIETNKLSKGTIGADESMHLATQDMTATINGISYSTLRLSIGSKFGVLKDGKLVASGASVSGTFINGDFNESTRRCTFGVVIQNEAAFTSPRTDYLNQQYGRGGLLSIFARNALNVPSNSFRGVYCEGEVEIQGVTQLLKPVLPDGSQPSTNIPYALIAEGVDNRGDSIVSGDTTTKGKIIVTNYMVISDATGTISQNSSFVVANRNGDQNITVPSSGIIGQIIRIKKTNSGWCYIKDGSGNTINQIAFDRASVFIVYDGTNWI